MKKKDVFMIGICGMAFLVSATFTGYCIGKPTPINCSPTVNPTPNCHDWECKYIIRDHYSTEVLTDHYVDSYVENVDRSISFIASDGLITRIPYPYYEVIKNPNT